MKAANRIEALTSLQHTESDCPACEDCQGPVYVWFAPNELWNLVKGGPEATDDPGGMLCPNCFIKRAEEAGIIPTAWVLDRENLAGQSVTEQVRTFLRTRSAGAEITSEAIARAVQNGDRKALYNALTYLARSGELERISYGRYRIPQHTEPVAGEVEVVLYADAVDTYQAVSNAPLPGFVPLVTKSSYDALRAAFDSMSEEVEIGERRYDALAAAKARAEEEYLRAWNERDAQRRRAEDAEALAAAKDQEIAEMSEDLAEATGAAAVNLAAVKRWRACADALQDVLADALDEHDTSHGEITDPDDPHWSVRARALKDEGSAT